MDLLRRCIQRKTFLRKTHLICKGRVGLPGSRVASIDLFHHLVDLFEGETFGFGLRSHVLACAAVLFSDIETYDKEVGKGRGDAAEGAPKEEDLCTKVCITFVGTNQVRGYDGNDL